MYSLTSFSNYYKFSAKLYAIPSMDNMMGIDPYPKYFVKPQKLIEVLEFSTKPQSLDDGYVKDKESGLYLRNHSKLANGTLTEKDVNVQFADLSMSPPYWYSNAPTYLEWLRINMDAERSDLLHAMLNLYAPTKVGADTDPLVPVEHVYVEFQDWTTREYSRTDLVKWPKRGTATVSKI